MIKYAIPGLYRHHFLNEFLLLQFKNNPEYFNNDIEISAVYGIFPFCIWDGGRVFSTYTKQASAEEIEKTCNFYSDNNINVRLILTNNQLKEEHYFDRFGNLMLDICNRPGNQIVLNDENFKNYIESNYKYYSFISSTTKCITNPEDFKDELQKPFEQVCLDYNLNHNFRLLESLNENQKNKCEFLVNAICPSGCAFRKEHYRLNSLFNLSYGKNYNMPLCGIKETNLHPDVLNYKNTISFLEIREKYEPLGFSNFKLEGRTFDAFTLAENYANYLVKPEYQLAFLANFAIYSNT